MGRTPEVRQIGDGYVEKNFLYELYCICFNHCIRKYYDFLSSNIVIRPGAIGNIKTKVSNGVIDIKGDFVLESTRAYKDYNYRIHNNSIYITVYGTPISSKYSSGKVDITIKGDFSEIKSIYLEGKGESNLVWER